ncbi:MAG: proline--tRNA ligase, partial [Treponema sp.]|nr:proline--tRNA ligase [Treponema sp.]
NERPGVKFNDADLTGIPWRVVIGDKGLAQSSPQVEIKRRSEKENRMVELDKAAADLAEKILQELVSQFT